MRRRMKLMGITPYRLHQQLRGKVSKQTVYNFTEHGKAISSETLLLMMHELGVSVGESDVPPMRKIVRKE